MKCELCNQEAELHKFYWGFFNAEYDDSKWINVCSECQLRFLKASNIYKSNNNDLWLMYREIENKVITKSEEQTKRLTKIRSQKRY